MDKEIVGSSENEVTIHPARVTIIIGVVSGLSMGFLDITINMFSSPSGLSSFTAMLPPLVITIIAFFAIYLILWFLIVSHLRRFLKVEATPLALSLALFLVTIFIIPSLFSLLPTDLSSLVMLLGISLLISIASISIFISAAGYFTTKAICRTSNYKRRKGIVGFILAIPFVLAETVVFMWLRTYRIEIFSAQSLLLDIGYVLAIFFTLCLFYRLSKTSTIMRLLIAFVILVILSPLAALAFASRHPLIEYEGESHRIKHVILITVDTLRRDALSCYGSQIISTPHIDKLAKRGILFKKAISAAPWTLPSFSSIMTGLSPLVHKTTKGFSRLPDNLPTLAKYMHDAGYFTAAIGDNIFLGPKYNLSQGFLEYNFFPKSSIGSSFGVSVLQKLFPKQFPSEASTSDITELAIDWLDSNREKDFFLWVHYFDPHTPYTPPTDFLPKGEPPPRVGTSFSNMGKVKIRAGYFVPSLAERAWIKALYEGEVRYVDANVGKLLDALERLNLYDESLIIFTSDHGEEFWEHNSFGHGHTLYDEVLWVPLMIKLPLSTSKRQITKVVQTPSLMPTILDLCGITYKSDSLSFSSLSPLWGTDSNAFEDRPIVSTGLVYYDDRESVVFDGMKYIRSLLTGREELYNLARDPKEQISIAHSSPEKVQRAREILEDYNDVAKSLRERYHITEEEEIVLDKETIRRLKSLGYIQ